MRRALAVLLATALLGGCAESNLLRGAPTDRTPPTVVATEPALGAENVTDARISITFSEPMATNTVEIRSTPSLTWGTGTWSNGDRTVTFIPSDLRPNTQYTITVTGRDRAGNAMAQAFTLRFTTGSIVQTGVVAHNLLQNRIAAGVDERVYATFLAWIAGSSDRNAARLTEEQRELRATLERTAPSAVRKVREYFASHPVGPSDLAAFALRLGPDLQLGSTSRPVTPIGAPASPQPGSSPAPGAPSTPAAPSTPGGAPSPTPSPRADDAPRTAGPGAAAQSPPAAPAAPPSPTRIPSPGPQPSPVAPIPSPTPQPTPSARFDPAQHFVVVDLDTGLIYRWRCSELPEIKRAALFMVIWEATQRGYKPASGPCAPPYPRQASTDRTASTASAPSGSTQAPSPSPAPRTTTAPASPQPAQEDVARRLAGLDALVRELYQEAKGQELWRSARTAHEREAAQLRDASQDRLRQAATYLRLTSLPFTRLVLVPNLLAPREEVTEVWAGDVLHVLVGPSAGPNMRGVVRSFIRVVVAPVVESYRDLTSQSRELFELVKDELQARGWTGWDDAVRESLVRAVEARLFLPNPDEQNQFLDATFAEGFVLVRHFAERLPSLERGEVNLARFVETSLRDVNAQQIRQQWQPRRR